MAGTFEAQAHHGVDSGTNTSLATILTLTAGTDFTAGEKMFAIVTGNIHTEGWNQGATAKWLWNSASPDGDELGDITQDRNSAAGSTWVANAFAWAATLADTETIELQTRTSHASYDWHTNDNQIVLLNIEDIYADATQYVEASTTANTACPTGSWTEVETLAFTPNEVGEIWLIFWSLHFDLFNNKNFLWQLLDDSDAVVGTSHSAEGSTSGSPQERQWGHVEVWTADTTDEVTFKIQGQGGNAEITTSNAVMQAVRLDSISTNYTITTPSDATLPTSAGAITGATAAITPVGSNVLCLFTGNASAAGGLHSSYWFSKDSNVNKLPPSFPGTHNGWYSASAGTPEIPVMQAWVDTAASGATTYALYAHASVSDTLTDIAMLAIELDGGDGGPGAGGGGAAQKFATLSSYYD